MWLLLSEDGIQKKICRKQSYFMRVEDMHLAAVYEYVYVYECMYTHECACMCGYMNTDVWFVYDYTYKEDLCSVVNLFIIGWGVCIQRW